MKKVEVKVISVLLNVYIRVGVPINRRRFYSVSEDNFPELIQVIKGQVRHFLFQTVNIYI